MSQAPTNSDAVALGLALREARDGAGLNQAEAAERVGTSRSSMLRWESGQLEPPFSKVAALATLYGVSTDWLAGRTAFRRVFEPGKIVVDEAAIERVRELAFDPSGRIQDIPPELVRRPGIDYAWQLPSEVSLLLGEAAEAVHKRMQELLQTLRGREK